MNILSTQYTLKNKVFEIYVAGCSAIPHCTNCHNPETWDFNQGDFFDDKYFKEKIEIKIIEFDSMIRNIMIFGGEPLDQPIEELIYLLSKLCEIKKPIWLFTRYEIEFIPEEIKRYCDYIKCGRYIPNLVIKDNIQYGITLATSNQNIYKKGIDY